MKHLPLLLLLLLAVTNDALAWRPYNRFHVGAEANGAGSAFVGDASSELAAHYNPAGLAQVDKAFSLNYEVYTSVRINDILAAPPQFDFDSFSFFSLFGSTGPWHLSLSMNTLFNSFGTDQLYARGIKLSAAVPILPSLSLGAGLGPVILMEGTGTGFAFHYNLGLLWQINHKFRMGLAFQSPFTATWERTSLGSSLTESFPWYIEWGISWQIGPATILYFSLDYMGIDSIRFTLNGTVDHPDFGNDILARIHPHLGIRFLEPRTGAHLSLGIQTDSDYYGIGATQQYQLSLGVRFYGKKAIFNASLIDTLLFSLIHPENNHEERMNFSVSVRFD